MAIFQAVLRHAATFFGGWLGSQGLASDNDVDLAMGALTTLIGFGWSIYVKLKK